MDCRWIELRMMDHKSQCLQQVIKILKAEVLRVRFVSHLMFEFLIFWMSSMGTLAALEDGSGWISMGLEGGFRGSIASKYLDENAEFMDGHNLFDLKGNYGRPSTLQTLCSFYGHAVFIFTFRYY